MSYLNNIIFQFFILALCLSYFQTSATDLCSAKSNTYWKTRPGKAGKCAKCKGCRNGSGRVFTVDVSDNLISSY